MNRSIIIFDQDCGFCEKCCLLIKKLDFFRRFEYKSYQDEKIHKGDLYLDPVNDQRELKLIHKNGNMYGGGDAMIRICFELPLMAPLGWIFYLPPLKQIARKLYPIIANNRYKISKICGLK